jgi:hypothetical protein
MAISVVCPGCKKRFSVSDKFAGQKGPCPSCKATIQIPEKAEEVVVHAPEGFGPADSAGRAVLKPIFRQETTFSPAIGVSIGGAALLVLLIAIYLRSYAGDVPMWLLGLGAVVLGPPLALGGYTFLRDDELEPYRGTSVLVRSLICGLGYALLWGIYAILLFYVNEGDPFEIFQMAFLTVPLVLAGAGIAYVTFDIEFGSGVIHYALYLLVTVSLRLIMGLSAY